MVDYDTFRYRLRWYGEVFDPPYVIETVGPFWTERRARVVVGRVGRPLRRAQMERELGGDG